jgi:7-carboxy-7-deazaguanine synthase
VDQEYRHTWASMSAHAVLEEVAKLSGGKPLMITLSGGNPGIQPLEELIDLGHATGYSFGMETQGSVVKDWFCKLDMLVLSPKPPSSGMETDWEMLGRCAGQGAAQTVLKIVVFDDADFAYAQDVVRRFPDLPIYLQPGNHTPPSIESDDARVDIEGIDDRMRWLVDRVIEEKWYGARVLPQLHVMLWGNKRGV